MTVAAHDLARELPNWYTRSDGLKAKINEIITELNALSVSGVDASTFFGVDERTLTGNVTFTTLMALTVIVSASTSGIVITLGDASSESTMFDGGTYVFFNTTSEAVEIHDNGGTQLTLLGPGEYARLHLQDTSTAAGTWQVWDALQESILQGIVSTHFG